MGRGSPEAAVGGGADDDGGKSSWPELVGRHLVEAVAVIKSQRQDVFIKFFFGAGDAQPPDLDAHRVCLFLDANLAIVRTPVVG